MIAEIETDFREGSTTAIAALALGYSKMDMKTIVVLGCNSGLNWFHKNHLFSAKDDNIKLVNHHQFVRMIRSDIENYQCVLFDDANLMAHKIDGDPIACLKHRLESLNHKLSVFIFNKKVISA